LAVIFNQVIQTGEQTVINQADYLTNFGLNTLGITAGELWNYLYQDVIAKTMPPDLATTLDYILKEGTLATRIFKASQQQSLETIYRQLCQCLAKGILFEP